MHPYINSRMHGPKDSQEADTAHEDEAWSKVTKRSLRPEVEKPSILLVEKISKGRITLPHKIFCDGSPEEICVLLDGEEHRQSHNTPYNRPLEIEYKALKHALKLLPIGSSGVIYTDNQIAVARFNSDHYSPKEKDAIHREILDIISKNKLSLIFRWVPRR